MFVLKTLKESKSSSFSMFVHVLAIGKGEWAKNWMLGGGVIPAGGSAPKPVANIRTSSRDTAATFSKKENSALL